MIPAGFRSPRTLGTASMALIGAVMLLDLVQIASYFMQLDLLERAARGVEITTTEANSNDQRVEVLASLKAVLFIASGITFLVWFHRLYKNLATLTKLPLAHSPGWAVGGFIVPFLNLVRPYQMMCEAWSHNAPPDQAARTSLMGWWWGGWIVYSISARIASSFTAKPDSSIPELITMTEVHIASLAIGCAAAILAILVVQRQTIHQIARAEDGAVSEIFG